MSKPFTEEDLARQLIEDRTWRLKELSDLQNAIERSDNIQQRVLLRALVTISYAHWEGYIRFAAKKYMEHVALKKIQYSELHKQFYKNYFLARLASANKSALNITQRCELIEEILNSTSRKFSYINTDLINTQSNLNFSVFCDICTICGIDKEIFKDSESFIDLILLKRRNGIAHGEETFIDKNDMERIINSTISLMRNFANELDNNATLKSYKLQ